MLNIKKKLNCGKIDHNYRNNNFKFWMFSMRNKNIRNELFKLS